MIQIAGRPVSVDDALSRLRQYPLATVKRFDLPRCLPGPLTTGQVQRTKAVNSRIGRVETDWFVDRGATAPWGMVPPNADLRDADPETVDGLYDAASHLYGHFFEDRPKGVSVGKISKVLHLKYPALVPILDSQVRREYAPSARNAARESVRWRTSLRRLYWQVIRFDLLASSEALTALRASLAESSDLALYTELSDLRLMDALAWRPT